MKEVNALVESLGRGTSEERLLQTLELPDERVPGTEFRGVSRWFAALGSMFQFGDVSAAYFLGYVDPYRPRRTYYFGIRSGVVVHVQQLSRAT